MLDKIVDKNIRKKKMVPFAIVNDHYISVNCKMSVLGYDYESISVCCLYHEGYSIYTSLIREFPNDGILLLT